MPTDLPPAEATVRTVDDALLTRAEDGPLVTTQRTNRWIAGAVYDRENRLVAESQRLGGHGGDVALAADRRVVVRPQPQGLSRLSGDWLYVGHWMRHFGHFMTETLTTLWPDAGPVRGLVGHRFTATTIVVRDWQRELLSLAGCADLAIEVVGGRPVEVERLVVPSRSYAMSAWARPEAATVWQRVGAAAVGRARPDERPVYLSRTLFHQQRPHRRRADPATDVENDRAFAAAGFEVIHPETLSVTDQIARVAEARVVAGVAGSALHLVAFCRRPTLVVEVADSRRPRESLRNQVVVNHARGHLSALIPHGYPVARALDLLDWSVDPAAPDR